MATGKPNQVRWNPGRLVLNPTVNPSGNTYPFGGVEIGLVRALEFDESYELHDEEGEEYSRAIVAHHVTKRQAYLTCVLRGWDSSGVSFLPDGAVGAINAVVEDGGFDSSAIAGVKVLVVPDAVALGQKTVAQCTDLALAFYDAVYLPKASEKVRASYSEEIGRPVVFVGRPDNYGNLYQQEVLSGIGGFQTIAFTDQPDSTTITTVFDAAVTVYDANGNADTGYTGNITVALTSAGGATLGGTLTVAAVAGVATFDDLTVNMAGTYTLTATATGFASAVSSSFTIAGLP